MTRVKRLGSVTSRLVAAAAVMVAALGVSGADAHAGSLRGTFNGFRYVAAPGEANDLTITSDGRFITIADRGATRFGGPLPLLCRQVPAEVGIAARCDTLGYLFGPIRLHVDLGDGHDWLDAEFLDERVRLDVTAGPGENVVVGGLGDDVIRGGDDRDTLYGNTGNDLLDAGDGNDYVRGHGGDDDLRGGSGLNFYLGDGGNDVLRGGHEFEFFDGGGGDDLIEAGGGDDDVSAGRGNDTVRGGDGDDDLRGGRGVDTLFGDAGDDVLRARDGEPDQLDCGDGQDDLARVDETGIDTTTSCERVRDEAAGVEEPESLDEEAPAGPIGLDAPAAPATPSE